jgi:hypothetical protein
MDLGKRLQSEKILMKSLELRVQMPCCLPGNDFREGQELRFQGVSGQVGWSWCKVGWSHPVSSLRAVSPCEFDVTC